MKGAIMQPYLFPYIGYYQLAYEVENFIFLDDVNFIKKGYVNRNSILLNGVAHEFSIPVERISQFRSINEHLYLGEYSKFIKMLEYGYKKAPYYQEAIGIIDAVMCCGDNNVAVKNSMSIMAVFKYLNIERKFSFSSSIGNDTCLKGQERILNLCERFGIKRYRNSIGGQDLYDKKEFERNGVELFFLKSHSVPYRQGKHDFVPNLSMIDMLMYCDKEVIRGQLLNYALV